MAKAKTQPESLELENPRAVIGDNVPDYAAEETARLDREMGHIVKLIDDGIAGIETLPAVSDDDSQGNVDSYIVRMRDLVKHSIEPARVAEKSPHDAKSSAVQQWFKRHVQRLTDKITPKIAESDKYQLEKAARERAERERLAREAAEREAEARRQREAAEKAAREAEEAARRKRNADAKAEADQAAAEAQRKADEARAAERVAMQQTDTSAMQAGASSADLSRTRHAGGRMTTTSQVADVRILDRAKLDLEILRPYFKEAHLQAALDDYAKKTNYKGVCEGAHIGKKDAVVRR